MYSINGVPLDNAAMGWKFRAPSKPLSELVKRVQSLYVPGRAGVVTVDAPVDAPVLPLMVQTTRANLETLYALFLSGGTLTRTADASRSVGFQYISSSNDGYGNADAIVDVTFTIRLDGAFWRDAAVSTSTAKKLVSGITTANVFPGISAPVEDALIKITATVSYSGLVVTDQASQAAFAFQGALPTGGKALVYNCADQSAQIVDDPSFWYGGTDVSGQIDFYGDRFKITPFMPTPTDPGTRTGQLVVNATGVGSAATVQVQGQGAYLV